jgi:hypothetical protein
MLEVDGVDKELRSLGIETITGAFTVKSPLPDAAVAGAVLGIALSQPLYLAAGIAVGLAAYLHEQQNKSQHILNAPAAYLLLARQGLKPQTLARRVQRGARKMFFGV